MYIESIGRKQGFPREIGSKNGALAGNIDQLSIRRRHTIGDFLQYIVVNIECIWCVAIVWVYFESDILTVINIVYQINDLLLPYIFALDGYGFDFLESIHIVGISHYTDSEYTTRFFGLSPEIDLIRFYTRHVVPFRYGIYCYISRACKRSIVFIISR